MGWKCSFLFVGDIESGYFGADRNSSLQPQPLKSREIAKRLGRRVETVSDEHMMDIYPDGGKLIVGAYERGAYIADQKIADELEEVENHYLESAMACYPGGDLLALALHSVVNYAAFAYYKGGKLQRKFASAAEVGVLQDFGSKLPEEEKEYVDSFERDGIRYFPRSDGSRSYDYTIDAIAEEIVFNLAARPLGTRLDRADENGLKTEAFTIKPLWKFW